MGFGDEEEEGEEEEEKATIEATLRSATSSVKLISALMGSRTVAQAPSHRAHVQRAQVQFRDARKAQGEETCSLFSPPVRYLGASRLTLAWSQAHFYCLLSPA